MGKASCDGLFGFEKYFLNAVIDRFAKGWMVIIGINNVNGLSLKGAG